MKKTFLSLAMSLAILFSYTVVTAQISKEEQKFWKNKAKMYKKNPMSLKAEFENFQEQIKDLKRRNKELMAQGDNSQATDSLEWTISQLESDLHTERMQRQKLEDAYNAQTSKASTGNPMGQGLIYRVQIGAYVFYEMENMPSDASFTAEKADGYNKFIIGTFKDHSRADAFKDELRKIGMKDAFVVPYLDGTRVTLEEAETYLGTH